MIDTGLIAVCVLSIVMIAIYGGLAAWHRHWYFLFAAIGLGACLSIGSLLVSDMASFGLFACTSAGMFVACLCACLVPPLQAPAVR